jgi:hypothetical protein
MSRIIAIPTRKVKAVRKTARPSAPFGAGILPRTTRFEPTDEDRAAAAQLFADDCDWDARMASGLETCGACGRPVEPCDLECGLCCECLSRAEEATMASQYAGVGLGWHTY